MGQRRKDRESYWRDVLQRQAKSGLTVARFCEQESISAPSLYAWRRKLRERDGAPHPKNAGSDVHSGNHLLPVRIASSGPPTSVRLLLPQGVSLDVPSNVDCSVLTDLLRALRESTAC